MQSIEFNASATEGIIKIPEEYRDWYGGTIKVILLRQESTTPPMDSLATSRSYRPIGLAKDKFQVPPQFFEELPTELLDAFEGKK